jgi:hypothetical protein
MGKKARIKRLKKAAGPTNTHTQGVWVQQRLALIPETPLRIQMAATSDGLKRLRADLIEQGTIQEQEWPQFVANFAQIPWMDFLMGCITGNAARQIDLIWFQHDGNQVIPLTPAGCDQAIAWGASKWQNLTAQECREEITRIILSLQTEVAIPDLHDFLGGASQAKPSAQRTLVAHIGDPDELRRKANFGVDHWDHHPGDGTYLVKVQRPLLGPDPMRLDDGASFMVYNQDRSLLMLLNNRERQKQLADMMGRNIKVYVQVTLTGKAMSFDTTAQLPQSW